MFDEKRPADLSMVMKVPPSQLLIQVANDPSPDNYRNVEHVRMAVEDALNAAGYRLEDFDRILDFGCGVGRLLQALNLSRRVGQQLYGCDVNGACATWCRENLEFASVAHTALQPPLPYGDGSFELIVAISVFTHLSRPLQIAWSRELMRVLCPGGVALVTTCGLGMLSKALPAGGRWKTFLRPRWKRRELALLGATGHFYCFAEAHDSSIEGQREVFAMHSRDALTQIFSPLRLEFRADVTGLASGQDVSVFVKSKQGRCEVIAPVGAASTGQSIESEIPANGTDSNVVAHRFEARGDGPAAFRTYIAFAGRRFDLIHLAAECRVRGLTSSQTIAEGRFAFQSTISLGPSQYIPLTIKVPTTACEVLLMLTLRRAPWQFEPIKFQWWDSRIEVGPNVDDTPGPAVEKRPARPEMVRLDEALKWPQLKARGLGCL